MREELRVSMLRSANTRAKCTRAVARPALVHQRPQSATVVFSDAAAPEARAHEGAEARPPAAARTTRRAGRNGEREDILSVQSLGGGGEQLQRATPMGSSRRAVRTASAADVRMVPNLMYAYASTSISGCCGTAV